MKSFIVLVFMIFTLVSSTKADGWTNAGEFSYLYPNGTKQITNSTLTADGKSLVVITFDSSNKANNYYRYKLQRIDLETGIVDFDTLWITNKYSYKLSRDGLTAFEIQQYYQSYNCYVAYNLFDIFHSSRGYLFNEVVYNNQGNPYNESSVYINYIDYLSQKNMLIYGTSSSSSYSSPPEHTNPGSSTSGVFKIFDILNPKNMYKNGNGATAIYDYYDGINNLVFYHYYSSNSANYGSTSESSVILVDSNKNETKLFQSDNNKNAPKSIKLIGDSLLIVHRTVNKCNIIDYYDRNTNEFRYTFKFPFVDNNASFKIGLSNDGNYLVKSDNNKLQFYKSSFNYSILEVQIPDSLSTYTHYSFSKDDKYILTVNNENQFIRFENPLRNNILNAIFTISDSITIENVINKTFNCSTGNPSTYLWDFGNGITSNEFQPNFKYDAPGKYTISLTVEKDNQKSTQQKVVTVLPSFKSDFEIVSILEYPPIICKFKNTSSEFIDSLVWDFGDGLSSKSKDINITHQYFKEAEFNVKLKVYYNKFSDSIEKKVIIKDIKEAPLDPNIFSEYVFENTSQNHQKFYKVYETKDNGYILVGLHNEFTNISKANTDFRVDKFVQLYQPIVFNPVTPFQSLNNNETYYNNSLKLYDNSFAFSYYKTIFSPRTMYTSHIINFDADLNKINSIDSIFGNLLSISQTNTKSKEEIIVTNNYTGINHFTKFNILTGERKVIYNCPKYIGLSFGLYLNKFYTYYYAYTPISNNYSYYAYYNESNPQNYQNKHDRTYFDQSITLIKQIPFRVFRNIDTSTFVGLDTLGNIYKFNANGDSLNKISLTKGLRNIAVNGSLYYAVGFKDNHPVCYTFDNNLNMKDTIDIEQRDGAFLDALVCKSGDLVLAGYKYIPSKTDTAGKLLRSSYILKINKYTEPIKDTIKIIPEDTTKAIPITVTNPIDHIATIRFAVDSSATFHYEAYDFLGNLVFKTADEKIEKEYTGSVDFSGLAPGVYIFKFYINGKIQTKKVIYQK